MRGSETLRSAGRLAALAAVGLVLGASDAAPPPPRHRVTFDVSSDCGPAGRVTVDDDVCPYGGGCGTDCKREELGTTGTAAVGFPALGELGTIGPDAPTDLTPGTDAISAGHFVLAGAVEVPGAVPPVTVDRLCRFAEGPTAGTLAVTCTGPAPESACTGILTVIAVEELP